MVDETRDDDPEGLEPTELPPTVSSAPAGEARDRIGPYRLLQKVGEGGMGEVYQAEQTHPVRRRVALKLIKAGMDTRRVVARFEAERQALAMMDHPAVAKVFDAGATAGGRPYFAMEYVKGVPITEHCDRHRLTTRERLELFMQVCDGVQHAHHKAIIHRDLKPSNVLVTLREGKPEPKIIDFGVAKAIAQKLTERTMFTELGVLIGTPEYMSPEQAEMTGQEVDTRTDVYSLGVMLYELLSGMLPFDSKELRQAGFDGIRRRIREEEPPKPSTRLSALGADRSRESARLRNTEPLALRRQLSGDLDWITMKALEKNPGRRYGSPRELATDIGRHLNDEPVAASPPSKIYRASKFARRHQVGVAISAAGIFVLSAFALTMAIQASRIAAARDRADLEAGRARASQLVTLGNVALETDTTSALAYAMASLERVDSPAGRQLAHQALWRGPAGFSLGQGAWGLDFSRDGRLLAAGSGKRVVVRSSDGRTVSELQSSIENDIVKTVRFVPESNLLLTTRYAQPSVNLWSVPEGRLIHSTQVEVPTAQGKSGGQGFFVDAEIKRIVAASRVREGSSLLFQSWAIERDGLRRLDHLEIAGAEEFLFAAVAALDPTGQWLAYGRDREIFLVELASSDRRTERLVGRHDAVPGRLAFHPSGEVLASIDQAGEIRFWSLAATSAKLAGTLRGIENCFDLRFDRSGRYLAAANPLLTQVWDLTASPDADPLVLDGASAVAFHPAGAWIATANAIWPLDRTYPRILRGHTQKVTSVGFDPEGNWIASGAFDRTIRVWPLDPAEREPHRVVYEGEAIWEIRVDPGGESLLATAATVDPILVSLVGKQDRALAGFKDGPKPAVAFGPGGRRFAVGGGHDDFEPEARIRVWERDSDDVLVLDPGDGRMITEIAFAPDGALISASSSGDLRLWDLNNNAFELLRRSSVSKFALSANGRRLLGVHDSRAFLYDLAAGSGRELASHGNRVVAVALDPRGEIAVTASADGVIRVGAITGEEPHLLMGHDGPVNDVAVSPDGRWIASAGDDATVRLWPTPAGRPFHALPNEEFLSRLRALTNRRVVEDGESGTGYRVDLSAFPGWEHSPTW